ncbi:MAG: PEGA domain-containing protein [Candidatus Angelobacter sp.]
MRHLMILFLSCSVAFAKSQPPVAVVVKAPVDSVKANAVQLATADGYTIDQEGQFQILFAKNISGKAGFMTNMLLAPSACSNISPRYLMTVMFVPGQDGVTLRPVMQYEHAGPLCRAVRENLDGKNVHQTMEAFAQDVKTRSEQPANTASSPEIQKALVGAKENTEAAASSPAAAASLAAEGHVLTKEEIAQTIKEGRASTCAIITYPPGADVFIDGNKAGITPLVINLMRRDAPRTVTVKLAGYKTFEKEFEPDGKPIPLGLTLEKE